MPSLLGIYDLPGDVAAVSRRLRSRGFKDVEVYAPAAFPELDEAVEDGPSRVRIWTLVGGLTGVVTGFFITIWMSNDWPVMIGGKPFASIPPYVVIGFELAILFGGLATLLGLLAVGKLPYGSFGKNDAAYSARFSAEEFGVVVECQDRDVREVDALMRSHDAKEVTVVEA
ncbi:MAG: DUF3341 domain-containing protein [Myxococcota bacterium]|nr:DUF3341 domain-containing protein [Myxococcota bacterium]